MTRITIKTRIMMKVRIPAMIFLSSFQTMIPMVDFWVLDRSPTVEHWMGTRLVRNAPMITRSSIFWVFLEAIVAV